MPARHSQLTGVLTGLTQAKALASATLDHNQVEFASLSLNPTLLKDLAASLKQPDWHCLAHNQIQGEFSQSPYSLDLDTEFDLAVKPLINAHLSGDINLEPIFNQIATPIGPDVKAMLVDLALPRALGVLTHARYIELLINQATLEILKPQLPPKFFMELVLDGNVVRFDYSRLLTPLISDPASPTLILDPENFKDHVLVPLNEFLLGKPFHRSFSWALNLEDTNLTLDVALHLTPLKT